MPENVIWSPKSVEDLEKILEYLNQNWSVNVSVEFLNEVDLVIRNISSFPKVYPLVNKRLKIRKSVISKHNSLFYREQKKCIHILRIFDTRQNPDSFSTK